MKNTIIALFLLLTITNCKAQEGRIETLGTISRLELPNGTYLKDTNDKMLFYVGTWKGVHNGKHILLKIQKLTKRRNDRAFGKYWYEDEMIGRYIVYNGDPNLPGTTIIASSINQINELSPLKSVGDGRNNEFEFAYTDYQFCSASGELILKRNLSNPNELNYDFDVMGKVIFDPDCPYTDTIPFPLPLANFNLIRVN
jgi:hypothetical protein